MKAVAFKATPKQGLEASKALLQVVGKVMLTDNRKVELKALAELARKALERPLSTKR